MLVLCRVESDPLVPAQGVNQHKNEFADRHDNRIFPARENFSMNHILIGAPDWVPQFHRSKSRRRPLPCHFRHDPHLSQRFVRGVGRRPAGQPVGACRIRARRARSQANYHLGHIADGRPRRRRASALPLPGDGSLLIEEAACGAVVGKGGEPDDDLGALVRAARAHEAAEGALYKAWVGCIYLHAVLLQRL